MTERAEDVLDRSDAERTDQLVLEIEVAHEEAELLHSARQVVAEPGTRGGAGMALLPHVAEAGKLQFDPRGPYRARHRPMACAPPIGRTETASASRSRHVEPPAPPGRAGHSRLRQAPHFARPPSRQSAERARLGCMKEARLQDPGTGLALDRGRLVRRQRARRRRGGLDDFGSGCVFESQRLRSGSSASTSASCSRASPTASTTPSRCRRTSWSSPASASCSSRARSGAFEAWDFVHCPAGHGARLRRRRGRAVRRRDGRGADPKTSSCSIRCRSSRPATARARRRRAGRKPGVPKFERPERKPPYWDHLPWT